MDHVPTQSSIKVRIGNNRQEAPWRNYRSILLQNANQTFLACQFMAIRMHYRLAIGDDVLFENGFTDATQPSKLLFTHILTDFDVFRIADMGITAHTGTPRFNAFKQ
eukprot:NODE_6899_length_810_cov_2.390102_g6663_i0.p2 GENE.NODE_6899_length_810_cov_2.390102_g6663_i0~~NODE_6899_length_810_cov_2.390102_g6663_i0.p2  ORF type:complete len:107 (+),score=1.21 NODE_6899_length_810_cov_2.390102_g6663_i0:422-742(+)